MVKPELIVSGTITGVEAATSTLPLDIRHVVGDRDLLRLVDDALDLGGDVDLAARVGEWRVGDDGADQQGLGAQIQLARRGPGDFLRFLGGRRDREVSGNQGVARLG